MTVQQDLFSVLLTEEIKTILVAVCLLFYAGS